MRANGEAERESDAAVDGALGPAEYDLGLDVPEDPRFGSGVPSHQRTNELDFIQMSGLTRPEPARGEGGPPDPSLGGPVDAEEPLSFYEKGVADVDVSAGPRAIESPAGEAEEDPYDEVLSTPSHHDTPHSQSLDDLRSIVDELAGKPVESAPEPQTPSGSGEASYSAGDLHESLSEEFPEAVEEAPVPQPPSEPPASLSLPPAAGSTDDFDAALDFEAPPAPPRMPEQRPSARLEEAEELLGALEEQPRDDGMEGLPVRRSQMPSPPALPERERRRHSEEPRMAYEYSAAPSRRRHSRHSGRRARRVLRYVVLAAVLCAIVASGVLVYQNYVSTRILSASELFGQAQSLADAGQYQEASRVYLEFARRFPDHARRAEAQFEAGFLLQVAHPEREDLRRRLQEEALTLLTAFIAENPASAKRARAETLVGTLHYELGHYEEAIRLLRDPSIAQDDPEALLPVLRMLGSACRATGSTQEAMDAFLQAAALPNNVSADFDYCALGDLYRDRAEAADSEEQRRKDFESAVQFWQMAVEVPTMDPSDETRVKQNIDRARKELGEDDSETEETADALAPALEAVAPAVEQAADPEAGSPAPEPAWAPPGDEERPESMEASGIAP